MSNQAVTWAYAQGVKPAGAKFVLVTLANFADANGHCYPSQRRLAADTGLSERAVRNHLAALEADGFIRRSARRRKDGSRTSDAFNLNLDQTYRQELPVNASGRSRRTNRQISPDPPADLARHEPSVEPSVEPSGTPPLGSPPHDHDGSLFAEPNQETSHVRNQTRRGTRLDENWEPSARHREFGRSLGLHDTEIDRQVRRFKNYWIAKSGKEACKRDWSRTFENWLDREVNDYGRGPGHTRGGYAGPGRGEPVGLVATCRELLDRADLADTAGSRSGSL